MEFKVHQVAFADSRAGILVLSSGTLATLTIRCPRRVITDGGYAAMYVASVKSIAHIRSTVCHRASMLVRTVPRMDPLYASVAGHPGHQPKP
jgi:hypothetical protein